MAEQGRLIEDALTNGGNAYLDFVSKSDTNISRENIMVTHQDQKAIKKPHHAKKNTRP